MNIQSTHGYCVYASQNISPRSPVSAADKTKNTTTASPKLTDTATISPEAKKLYSAQYDTSEGIKQLDIDYFNPKSNNISRLVPLLLPTQKNINALCKNISATLPNLLDKYGIPSAPSEFSYDNQGQIQLPEDYQYATEFEQMLEENPSIARELSTVNALASQMSGMKKARAFQQEYSRANTQAEVKALTDKYSFLFTNQRRHDEITMGFVADGSLNVRTNGELLS